MCCFRIFYIHSIMEQRHLEGEEVFLVKGPLPTSGKCGFCQEDREHLVENTYKGIPIISCDECFPDAIAEILDGRLTSNRALE